MSEIDSMEALLHRSVQNLCMVKSKDGIEVYAGHIDGENNFASFLTNLNALGVSFYTRRSRKCKSSIPLFISDRKDSDINIPFMGSPFKILKTMYMMCCQDGNYNPKSAESLQPPSKKRRVFSNPTKKIGCPAYMIVKCIIVYKEDAYKVKAPCTPRATAKLKVLERLNKDLTSNNPPVGTYRYILLLSPEGDHIHSVDSVYLNQTLHPSLQKEIYRLANQNICSMDIVRAHLQEMVSGMFKGRYNPKPDILNRAFYPTDKIIHYHLRQALLKFSNAREKRQELLDEADVLATHPTSQEASYISVSDDLLEDAGDGHIKMQHGNILSLGSNVTNKDIWNKSRASLINMIGFTYLEHSEGNSLKLSQAIKKLERDMKVSAQMSQEVLKESKRNLPERGAIDELCEIESDTVNALISEQCESGDDSDSADYFIIEVSEEK